MEGNKNQYKSYTKKQLAFIYKNMTLPHILLAAAFNKKFGTKKTGVAIKGVCEKRKWRTGRTGCFEKGHTPANKGTKGLMKANITSFKKGNCPVNHKPVGSDRINKGDGCILIKTAEPNIYRYKHRVIWEAAYGKIQRGMVVIFKDSNQLNCNLDNLELVNRRMLLYLNQNGYTDLPEELKPTMLAVAKVECKVFSLVNN